MLKRQLNNLSVEAFAKEIANDKDAVIIDVRTVKEYNLGHIPNAINLDYLSTDFLDQIEQLDKSRNYFIYCRSGRRSIRVGTWMRNGGFDNQRIFNLDTGFAAWQERFPKMIIRNNSIEPF